MPQFSSLDCIIDFVNKYGGVSYSLEELRESIEGFIKNNTFVVLERDGELAAVCVWNMDGNIAQIEEVVIHPKHRKQGLLRYICILGLEKFPDARYLRFCRERKYEGREPRMIDIYKFIGGFSWEANQHPHRRNITNQHQHQQQVKV